MRYLFSTGKLASTVFLMLPAKRRLIIVAILALPLTLSPSTYSLADTVYVRDVLYVPLRGGQSTSHRILHQGIRSGTVLERLETNPESGFSRVRMQQGLEGWVQSQYLVTKPVARDILDETRQSLDRLKSDYQLAQLQIEEQQNGSRATAEQILTLQQANSSLDEELTTIKRLAANVIAIDNQNDELQRQRDRLNVEISDLEMRNEELQDTSDQSWFLRGAATILLGLLFGFWVARKLYYNEGQGWG